MESQKQRCFQFARAAIAKSHDLDGSHNKNELSQFCAVLHLVAQLCLTLCDPVDYAHQTETSIHNGLETEEPLPCHAGHRFPDCIFQVNARSNRELGVAEYALRLLDLDSFKPDHQI